MKSRSKLFFSLGLAALLAILNYIAIVFSFYWTLGWYDYMMHFLGGLTVGVVLMWLLGIEQRSVKNFVILFILALLVGIAWEVFEYFAGITESTQRYAVDTSHDLIMDMIGSVFAYFVVTVRPSTRLGANSQESF